VGLLGAVSLGVGLLGAVSLGAGLLGTQAGAACQEQEQEQMMIRLVRQSLWIVREMIER
jgi:hypothetical protein